MSIFDLAINSFLENLGVVPYEKKVFEEESLNNSSQGRSYPNEVYSFLNFPGNLNTSITFGEKINGKGSMSQPQSQ